MSPVIRRFRDPSSAFAEAALIADGRAPIAGLATHEFPIARYRDARRATKINFGNVTWIASPRP